MPKLERSAVGLNSKANCLISLVPSPLHYLTVDILDPAIKVKTGTAPFKKNFQENSTPLNLGSIAQNAANLLTQVGLKILGAIVLFVVGRWLIRFATSLVG